MGNIPVLSGAGATVYLKSTGVGSDADPFVPEHTTVASIAGFPSVIASIPNVPSVKIASWFPGADVVASVVGYVGVSATIPNVPSVKIASWFPGADVVASVIGNVAVNLNAGTNNVGDVDVLSFVGDSADLDSDAGTDAHAVVAWGLPGAGGHVVGGTGANPLRMDPVASTVMPVSVASWFPGAGVVASVVGFPSVLASIPNVPAVAIVSNYLPNVTASVIGNPAVIASIAGVPGMAILSAYAPMSVTGTLYAVVNTGAVGTQYNQIGGTVNILGGSIVASIAGIPGVSILSAYAPITALASLPNVVSIKVASWFPGADVVASVIGNAAVTATVAGVPTVRPQVMTYAGLLYTSVPINISGSGLVAGNIVASSAKPLILCGYQFISTGTVFVGIYDGSFNNALTGSLQLIPASGIGPTPNPWAMFGMTASGRALVLGLSASCNVAGAMQYYEG